MLRKQAMQLGWTIVLMATTVNIYAQNKVIVIPLYGDEAPTSKIIFWTDDIYKGDLGGVSGADGKCQLSADNAMVKGTFKAWISDTAVAGSIPARPDFTYYDLPYQNVDGTPVAGHFVDFLDSEFVGLIRSVTAATNYISYWTGLNDNGDSSGTLDCQNWTSRSNSDNGTVGFDRGGLINGNWSNLSSPGCHIAVHLLCFEQ